VTHNSTEGRRDVCRNAWLLLGIFAFAAAAQARAEVAGPRSPGDPQVRLVAAGNSFWSSGSGAYYGSLTGSVACQFSSLTRPRKAGVFAAYRVTSGTAEPDSLMAAGWASTDFSRWQANLNLVYLDPRRGAGHLLYAGNVRYRMSGDRWLGVEAMGRAGDGRPAARLFYEGQVAGFLNLRFSVGLDAGGRPEAMARSDFVWRIR
jgi:hypothetical protein